jgi:hypothetical protein
MSFVLRTIITEKGGKSMEWRPARSLTLKEIRRKQRSLTMNWEESHESDTLAFGGGADGHTALQAASLRKGGTSAVPEASPRPASTYV